MENRQNNSEREDWAESMQHEVFLELCALSTSGEITEEEHKILEAHLSECPSCRLALQEFVAAAALAVPLLHTDLIGPSDLELSDSRQALEQGGSLPLHNRNGRRPHVNWNYVWMPLGAAVLLIAALGIYSFQFGRQSGREVTSISPGTSRAKQLALEQQISDFGHERELLKAQLAQQDGMIIQLRSQIEQQSEVLAQAKSAQSNLEQTLQSRETQSQQAGQEQGRLTQKLEAAQASLEKTQAELDSMRKERSQVESRAESFEAQIRDLHGQLRDSEQEVGKQQELLAHDRDIRDLMGARDLYIAEVFDVAKDGKTQKPYGRVFYTKGKSLVFYAYDLDQQTDVKNAGTFQAWGSRGPDRQQATSLGVFYEDNLGKKRWVLKFDDPKRLEQIDAVFVTVEPNGGSRKPSGKPLLFAYLKVDPNHP